MATIALNWELGADLGHISRYLSIALRLRERGHRPVLLLRDITRAESVLGPHKIEFLQAPVWLAPVQGLPPDINFTETLFRFGFLYPDGLLSMTRAWRSLWQLVQPQLMLFDHAPTAMLAARGLGIPRMVLGNSFAVPPPEKPLPRFRWWASGAGEMLRLMETEERVTRNCNYVLNRLGALPIRQVSDLYEAEATYLCARPAMDGYGERSNVPYIGPINNLTMGVEPLWPEGAGPKVFAYLKPKYKHFEPLLNAISASKGRYLIFAPGLSEQLRQRYESGHVVFSASPLNMSEVIKQCSAILCHAGGMTDIALDAGIPVLLLPTQMEQIMTSHRVANLGAGVFLPPEGNPGMLPKLIKQILDNGSLHSCASSYATSLPVVDQYQAVETVVDASEALIPEAS